MIKFKSYNNINGYNFFVKVEYAAFDKFILRKFVRGYVCVCVCAVFILYQVLY